MNEEKEKQVDVVDTETPDEHLEDERRVAEQEQVRDTGVPRDTRPAETMDDGLESLFEADEAKRFRDRWLIIQGNFVDDPTASVKQADDLVTDVIKSVTTSFSNRRLDLEKQWHGDTDVSTEDLRMAIKRYRSFFDRLLTLES